MQFLKRLAALLILSLSLHSNSSEAKNLHLIDQNEKNGFALYRTGKPNAEDLRELCQLGVTEMMVLSGDAEDYELKNQKECPTLKVIYNIEQEAKIPLDRSFLEYFSNWVETAQVEGKKVAFRCSCGCHRTGRLAAFYRMKYNGFDSEEAIEEMKELGRYMMFFRFLKPQVRALEDFIKERPCDQKQKYCVKDVF